MWKPLAEAQLEAKLDDFSFLDAATAGPSSRILLDAATVGICKVTFKLLFYIRGDRARY